MAPTKPQKSSPSAPPASTPAPSLASGLGLQYRNLAVAGVVYLGLWVWAIASRSTGGMVFLGVLTLVLGGFGLYTWRWYTKQKQLMEIAKRGIENPEARKAAIKELEAREAADGDVTNALMRAQLELQDDPEKAIATLDGIDMKKVPAMMLNEVRGMKAQVYLVKNRVAEAGELADQIQLSQIQQVEVRSVMAATVAEAWARTGKVKQAGDILSLFSPDDAAYASARVPLLYARIFTNFADSKRDLARKDMVAMCKENFQYLGRFMMPNSGVRPELVQMAQDVIQRDDNARKSILEMQGTKLNRAQRRSQR
jgi:hypothetical protein